MQVAEKIREPGHINAVALKAYARVTDAWGLSLKLAVEPAGQITQRLGHDLFGVFGRRLPGRAVARDVDRHRVFVVVAPAVADLGGELVEVPPLDGLQPVGDAVQRCIGRGVIPDARGRARRVGPVALEASAVALAPEAGEPDAGLGPRTAAHQADGRGFQADTEDLADPFEILMDRVPPIVVGTELAIPAERLFLGGIG